MRQFRRRLILLTSLIAVLLASVPVRGQQAAGHNPDKALQDAIDAVAAKALDDAGTPGAVVVVVRNGQVVLARGCGFASFEKKTPVDPARTLFYLGSVTKTFTAIAVMQLAEQGKLDLHADVNRYLRKVRVPASYAQPVTLHHLLTHTAGFDDKNIGYVARTAAEAQTLENYLSSQLPPRVAPPGERTAYSNHGFGLAGLVVENVSGMPFADYVEQSILRPLGMEHSTAHVPPPDGLLPDLAPGHTWSWIEKRPTQQPLGYRNLPPAGSVSASGLDMARYMLMHLRLGRAGEGEQPRILSEEAARAMQRQQFTHHRELLGMAYAFYERWRGTQRLLEHAGQYIGYACSMTLVPEAGVGIFVATNGGSFSVPGAIRDALLDQMLPAQSEAKRARLAQPSREFLERRAELDGSYALTRLSRSTIERVAVWDNQVSLRAAPGGSLEVKPRNRPAQRYFEVAPLVFENERGERLAFRVEPDGRIRYFFTSLPGLHFPGAFERLTWRDDLRFQLPVFLSASAVLASTFTLWPMAVGIAALVRRIRKRPRKSARLPRAAVAVAIATGVAAVIFLVGLDALLGNSGYRTRLVYGLTPEMYALLGLPIVLLALAAASAFFCVRLWRSREHSTLVRLYYSLVALAAVLFVALLANLNLIGFHY